MRLLNRLDRRTVLAQLVTLLLLLVLSGCVLFYGNSSEEDFRQLGIDEGAFYLLPLCQQVRIYAEVGAHHLDMGHSVAITPLWVTKSLASAPADQVSNCIALEGDSLLQILDVSKDNYENVSFSIHALIYKAAELNLFEYQAIKDFAYKAVCSSNVKFPASLVKIYYVREHGSFPNYIYHEDAISRMTEELCN